MSKFELSLAKDYVPSWTVVDGIRELFQNALDQEVQCPGNTASWTYNPLAETLTISNKKSTLTTRTLLLGATSKADNTATIGQFGEGYKVATLVLLRNEKPVTFYNYGAREVWTTRFVKSKRYGAEVLTFDVDKKYPWQTIPDNDLTVVIGNISPQEYDKLLVPANLHLQHTERETKSTVYGDILMDTEHSGMVYVNGLFVCKYPAYKYGYDFKPEHIKLDRDRKLVSDFDLRWLASKMWSTLGEETVDIVALGIADVEYVNSTLSYLSADSKVKVVEAAHAKFTQDYGVRAIPVSTQSDAEAVPHGYKAVIVPTGYRSMICSSSKYVAPVRTMTPVEKLKLWFELFSDELSYEAKEAFEDVYAEVENI
jgi:hypothetical protein